MAASDDRFEAKVDRSGDHHLWTGAKKADGTGLVRVKGRLITAHRRAWEIAHGDLSADVKVVACPGSKSCVRIEHLSARPRGRARSGGVGARASRGMGSKVEVRPGVWKLSVSAGRYENGRPRRIHRMVYGMTEDQATKAQIAFAAEVQDSQHAKTQADRDMTLNRAVELYLQELGDDRGRERRTLASYRGVHTKWFAPKLGERRLRDLEEEDFVRVFGRMRRAGLSRSRLDDGRNLYAPLFRWAKRRRVVSSNPLADFEVPPSLQVAKEHVPPEVDQLVEYLSTAVRVIPDVAPVLTLAAVTGMRRGELVSIRRSRVFPARGRIVIDAASDGRRVKTTKTRRDREIAVDPETMAMLHRHCEAMDERAAVGGITIPQDAFVFSLEPDCSVPMSADYVSKRVSVLKDHLGIGTKKPETMELEDEALRLFRQPPPPKAGGRTGPQPHGGMSYEEIGRRLGRSTRWAFGAVAAARRRDEAGVRSGDDRFDGSIVALRKFTSSELLDAGFNVSMVANRQGHSPQVLVRHYAKARRSADQKAALHLGQIVHGQRSGDAELIP